ncbi:MAG: DUF6164 family protein [Gammaproteobacteria bacterium]|jgi:hypothetical protein|nr:DUF6164 family protein [Gammaproteobacteria bacterium]
MARLLMSLRHVPADEAEEVCALLREHGVDFYETPPGRWGISSGGIWLNSDDDTVRLRARALLDDYQRERQLRARAEREDRRRSGEEESVYTRLKQRPLGTLLRLAGIILVLYLFSLPLQLLW